MDKNTQRRALIVIFAVSSLLIFDILSRIVAIDVIISSLILRWLFFTVLITSILHILIPSEDLGLSVKFGIGCVLAIIYLLPLIYFLPIIYLILLVGSYLGIEGALEEITSERMAELIDDQSSKIRGVAFNSVAISLAAIAFLFSAIKENPSSDPSFLPFVLSILFLFVSIIMSEHTLKYNILVEFQSYSFIFGVLFLFLGILRAVGQFTGIGVKNYEFAFFFIMTLWSVGGMRQRTTYRIVTGDDPRIDDDQSQQYYCSMYQ